MDEVNEETKIKNQRIFVFLRFINGAFCIGATLCVILYSYYGIFTGNLLFRCYVPDKYFFTKEFVTFTQLIFIVNSLPVTLGYDALVMYFCYKQLTQFQIVAYKIENITNYEDPNLELNRCIDYHSFLLR